MEERKKCEEISDRLSEYLDGRLRPEEMELVEEHTDECMSCRSLLLDLNRLREKAGLLPVPEIDKDTFIETLAEILKKHRTAERNFTGSIIYGQKRLRFISALALVLVAVSLTVTFYPELQEIMRGNIPPSSDLAVTDIPPEAVITERTVATPDISKSNMSVAGKFSGKKTGNDSMMGTGYFESQMAAETGVIEKKSAVSESVPERNVERLVTSNIFSESLISTVSESVPAQNLPKPDRTVGEETGKIVRRPSPELVAGLSGRGTDDGMTGEKGALSSSGGSAGGGNAFQELRKKDSERCFLRKDGSRNEEVTGEGIARKLSRAITFPESGEMSGGEGTPPDSGTGREIEREKVHGEVIEKQRIGMEKKNVASPVAGRGPVSEDKKNTGSMASGMVDDTVAFSMAAPKVLEEEGASGKLAGETKTEVDRFFRIENRVIAKEVRPVADRVVSLVRSNRYNFVYSTNRVCISFYTDLWNYDEIMEELAKNPLVEEIKGPGLNIHDRKKFEKGTVFEVTLEISGR